MSVSTRGLLLLLLCVEAAVLAVLETFFLLVRLDGTLLPRLGDLPFPVTIAVAVVTTPLLVQWAADLSGRVVVAAAPLLVWFFTIFALGYLEPGGIGKFLLGDWRTLLLIAGGALTGAVAVGAVMARNAANRPGLYDPAGIQ
ncbi:hypothetical protein SAMN05216188_102219 [Lentzea xinjiangensis]|uniref:Uncharacterized protein n=1 Tax=Lentzea xinjiangensis TaxID=402600 RepID=A0A1H9DQE7_9PSEU|nr:hypothetical protein [Lentzea xinjiangensis]SEQ14918.1 hypothetical protein SAMN05216188_102219 [Lentzea xinjiangensis]